MSINHNFFKPVRFKIYHPKKRETAPSPTRGQRPVSHINQVTNTTSISPELRDYIEKSDIPYFVEPTQNYKTPILEPAGRLEVQTVNKPLNTAYNAREAGDIARNTNASKYNSCLEMAIALIGLSPNTKYTTFSTYQTTFNRHEKFEKNQLPNKDLPWSEILYFSNTGMFGTKLTIATGFTTCNHAISTLVMTRITEGGPKDNRGAVNINHLFSKKDTLNKTSEIFKSDFPVTINDVILTEIAFVPYGNKEKNSGEIFLYRPEITDIDTHTLDIHDFTEKEYKIIDFILGNDTNIAESRNGTPMDVAQITSSDPFDTDISPEDLAIMNKFMGEIVEDTNIAKSRSDTPMDVDQITSSDPFDTDISPEDLAIMNELMEEEDTNLTESRSGTPMDIDQLHDDASRMEFIDEINEQEKEPQDPPKIYLPSDSGAIPTETNTVIVQSPAGPITIEPLKTHSELHESNHSPKQSITITKGQDYIVNTPNWNNDTEKMTIFYCPSRFDEKNDLSIEAYIHSVISTRPEQDKDPLLIVLGYNHRSTEIPEFSLENTHQFLHSVINTYQEKRPDHSFKIIFQEYSWEASTFPFGKMRSELLCLIKSSLSDNTKKILLVGMDGDTTLREATWNTLIKAKEDPRYKGIFGDVGFRLDPTLRDETYYAATQLALRLHYAAMIGFGPKAMPNETLTYMYGLAALIALEKASEGEFYPNFGNENAHLDRFFRYFDLKEKTTNPEDSSYRIKRIKLEPLSDSLESDPRVFLHNHSSFIIENAKVKEKGSYTLLEGTDLFSMLINQRQNMARPYNLGIRLAAIYGGNIQGANKQIAAAFNWKNIVTYFNCHPEDVRNYQDTIYLALSIDFSTYSAKTKKIVKFETELSNLKAVANRDTTTEFTQQLGVFKQSISSNFAYEKDYQTILRKIYKIYANISDFLVDRFGEKWTDTSSRHGSITDYVNHISQKIAESASSDNESDVLISPKKAPNRSDKIYEKYKYDGLFAVTKTNTPSAPSIIGKRNNPLITQEETDSDHSSIPLKKRRNLKHDTPTTIGSVTLSFNSLQKETINCFDTQFLPQELQEHCESSPITHVIFDYLKTMGWPEESITPKIICATLEGFANENTTKRSRPQTMFIQTKRLGELR